MYFLLSKRKAGARYILSSGIKAWFPGCVLLPGRTAADSELAGLVERLTMYLGELVCRAGSRLAERPVLIMLLPPGGLSRPVPGDDGCCTAGASGSSVVFSY